jgi:hemolysin activation/secretion protein
MCARVFKLAKSLKSIGLLSGVLVGALACLNVAQAQTSAGQLLQQNRELEPGQNVLPEPVPNPKLAEPTPAEPKPGQVTFVAKEFIFIGNTKVPSSQLQKLAASFLGKPITFDDLSTITDASTVGQNVFYPGEGRSAYIGAVVKF